MTEQTDQNFDPETGARDIIDLSAPAEEASAVPANTRVLRDLTEVQIADVTQEVVGALKTVYDPEIPVDIYELGLIYKVDFDPANDERGAKITIDMTLTAPGCPVAGEMPGWVEDAVLRVDGIEEVSVNMTFEPPWSPERMSEEAKLELGWM
ncbi:SUF system Fe-S cluster assembly protein [Parvularcula maris]|uniref:SUF system Fe-S cluster assembly protein n=1 Tax=Parvularcula maris TaxID=2965077 RepID=A0A9X2LAE4_9PROT|nr:SUF system Fe-S cluster assembly protein [Parvularcula maris]MCQ8185936.1 SUF system Fe-S cluster assembly protein [Parvularcula maris]